MTAISTPQGKVFDVVALGALSRLNGQPCLAAKSLYARQMVSMVTASGYMSDPAYGTTGAVAGICAEDSLAVAGESSGQRGVNLLCGAFWIPNHATHPVLLTHMFQVCYASDNNTVSSTSTDGPVAGVVCGLDSEMGVLVLIVPGLNYLLSQATLASQLASVANSLGASLIGVEDAGEYTTAATAEACFAEIYAYLKAQKAICFSLHDFREVDANGDVSNVAGNGGILASDTTPILRADTAESEEISWATGNADSIQLQRTLPKDFDDTKDCVFEAWVYSGTTNAASLTVETSWDGGAKITDSFDDSSTKSATLHKVTCTIANGDIPAGASNVTITLTPPTHATDAIQLIGSRLLYSPKLS